VGSNERSNGRLRDALTADVVVADRTRVAIALRYEPRRMSAPRVVAVGARLHARRLREAASGARVPIREDASLARALGLACGVGAEIPRPLYAAVARILADVYRARGSDGAERSRTDTPTVEACR